MLNLESAFRFDCFFALAGLRDLVGGAGKSRIVHLLGFGILFRPHQSGAWSWALCMGSLVYRSVILLMSTLL